MTAAIEQQEGRREVPLLISERSRVKAAFFQLRFPLTLPHSAREGYPLSTSSDGFTLVELVVVIVLLGILATFAVPRFFGTQPFAARGYADELAAALRHAQKVAVASNCDVSVAINAAGYVASQRAPSGATCSTGGAWSVPVLRSDGSALSGTAPSDATVGSATTVVFATDGKLRGAAPAPIAIGAHTISVDAITGYVSVQ